MVGWTHCWIFARLPGCQIYELSVTLLVGRWHLNEPCDPVFLQSPAILLFHFGRVLLLVTFVLILNNCTLLLLSCRLSQQSSSCPGKTPKFSWKSPFAASEWAGLSSNCLIPLCPKLRGTSANCARVNVDARVRGPNSITKGAGSTASLKTS